MARCGSGLFRKVIRQMRQPIFCFDVDGTLVDEQGAIHPYDIALLEAAPPAALFVACTGRPLEGLRRTFAQNGLFVGSKIPIPLVLQNGALIYLPGEVLLAYLKFPTEIQAALLRLAETYPEISFLFFAERDVHILWKHELGLVSARRFGLDLTPLDLAANPPFSKLMCLCDDRSLLEALELQVRTLEIDAGYSFPNMLEITPRGVNKGSAILRLLEQMGRGGEPFIAAGDGGNDLEMLSMAAVSLAPQSAPAEIQSLVQQVIDVSVDGLFAPGFGLAARNGLAGSDR